MNRSIWDRLGIEPTNDKKEIKAAYSRQAKLYHPAEHPEEFQMLREAYKRAIEIAEGKHRSVTVSEEPVYRLGKPVRHAKPEYEFDVDAEEDYDFSERQTAMFAFYVDMLEVFKNHVRDYSSKAYFEAVFKLWTKKPYKEEITPDFISAVLDRLDMGCLFHPVFYYVLEKALFSGKTGDDYRKLMARLDAMRTETELIKWKRSVRPSKRKINKMLMGIVDSSTPIGIGHLFDEGLSQKLVLKRFCFSKGVLWSVKGTVRYYFINDCTCKIKNNGSFVVRDVYGQKLFAMTSNHGYFYYVLRQLSENGCRMIWPKDQKFKSFTSEFSLDTAPFHKLVFDRRLNAVTFTYYKKTAMLILIVFLQSFLIFYGPAVQSFGVWGSLIYPFIVFLVGINKLLIWIVGLVLFVLLIMDFLFTTSTIGGAFIYRKLQKECNEEKAVYDIGNRIFVFKSYVVSPVENDFIPIKNITGIEPLKKTEVNGDGFLKITYNNGVCKDYFVGYMDTAMALYREIKKRWDACEKESVVELTGDDKQKMRLAKKYDRLRSKKKSIFKRQFLVDQNVRNQYDLNIIGMVVPVVYCLFFIFDTFIAHTKRPDIVFFVLIVLLFFMVPIFIIKYLGYLSFVRIDNELLLNACLQLRSAGVYYNMLYHISLLDDYFMSVHSGIIEIIPYKDIEWIGIEYMDKKENVSLVKTEEQDRKVCILLIKEYGKDPGRFCEDDPGDDNEKNVREIYGLIRHMHPEIKEFKEEKAE